MLRQAKKMAASQSESWVTNNTKPCAGCGAPIQRNGGCNHITCSRCHGHFCWVGCHSCTYYSHYIHFLRP